MSSEPKAFGKWHDFALLILGFILTSLIGTYLSARFQDEEERRKEAAESQQRVLERAVESRAREVDRASECFKEVSHAMDARHYYALRWAWALERGAAESELSEERARYRKALFEWNENLNRFIALIQRYFGSKADDVFQGGITPLFQSIDNELAKHQNAPKKIEADLDKVGVMIYDFNFTMLKDLQSENVGLFRNDLIQAPKSPAN